MPVTFRDLIAPLERGRFLDDFWTKKAVHLKEPGRTFDDVFGWRALDAVVNSRDLTFPKVKVSQNDKPVPPESFTSEAGEQRLVSAERLMQLFADGASFGITGADANWPPLRAIVECMYDTFLESVHTNVYCSPPNTQGFQCHFDLHEVFVMQVEGEKHWRVFLPTVESPAQSWRPEDAPGASVPPYLDVVLQKGDVLYVPRGHWHYAVALASTSVHVTVGVTCHKGTAFMDWLASEVAEDPLWRQNVPLLDAAVRDGRFALPEEWCVFTEELKSALMRKLSERDLVERFCKATLRDAPPLSRVSVPRLADGFDVDGFVFERPAGRRHFVERRGDGSVALIAGDREVELDANDVEFFSRLFAAETFTAADIRAWRPDADPTEVAAVLGELVRSGLLDACPR